MKKAFGRLKTIGGEENIIAGCVICEENPDPSSYTELVGVPPTLVPIIKEGSITIQHKCHNNLATIRAFMDNYNYNEHQNASSN